MNTDRRFWVGIGIFSLIIGIICFFPYWFTSRSFHDIDFSKTGQIGDTLGGIMGPFIAIAAAVLTFLAFWVQYQANLQQRQQFVTELANQKKNAEDQERIWKVERIENKFFSMLQIHRENINEINITDGIKGRESFKHMFNELKFTTS